VARFIPRRLFASQLFESQPLASHVLRGFDKAIRVITLAVIESETLLVKVAKKVKWFDRNISSADGSLEQAPVVFNPVSVNDSVNLFLRVIDNFVGVIIIKLSVRAKSITIDSRASLYVLAHFAVKRFALGVRHNHSPNLAVTRQQAHNGDFTSGLVSTSKRSSKFSHTVSQRGTVHVPSLAADEGFINFDFAAELGKTSGLHGFADAVKQKPRALLSDTDAPVNLIRTNAVLRIHDQPDSRQPLIKADRTIFHDSSQLDAEMLLAALANPDAASLNKRVFGRLTARASDNAIRPADRNHAAKRGVWIAKVLDGLNKGFWKGFVFHSGIRLALIPI
jgi:hypothetical protein